jgi:hypothetical protein
LKLDCGTVLKIGIRLFSCDTPARSMTNGTKGHAAKEGCQECEEPAVYNKTFKKVVYAIKAGTARTDESYAARKTKEQHLTAFKLPGSHVLEDIDVGMVSQFPIDAMHLVDLGVSRKLCALIFKDNCFQMKRPFLAKVSKTYESLRNYIPSEFVRKTRSLEQLSYWKATEGRLFILYTGFIFFKELKNDDAFYHYALINVALRILSNDHMYESNIDSANNMLTLFVQNYGAIYGSQNINFNVHNLLHLAACAKRYGPIYSFSCYAFENFMQSIKGSIRNSNKILQQMFNRMEEEDCTEKVSKINNGFCEAQKIPYKGCSTTYSAYQFNNFKLKNTIRDQHCVLKDGSHMMVENFSKKNTESVVIGRVYEKQFEEAFFQAPIDSREIGIYVVAKLADDLKTYPISDILYKCMRLPLEGDKFLVIPIIHSIFDDD